MFDVGDYLVYGKDVCKVMEIKKKYYNDNDYYVLSQVDDESLTREIPINNENTRALIEKKVLDKLIKQIPEIEPIEFQNDKMTENEYRKHLNAGSHEDLIKIIKTCCMKNKEKLDNDKKVSARDENYLKLAEKYLYTELSIVLDVEFDDVQKIIIDKLDIF